MEETMAEMKFRSDILQPWEHDEEALDLLKQISERDPETCVGEEYWDAKEIKKHAMREEEIFDRETKTRDN